MLTLVLIGMFLSLTSALNTNNRPPNQGSQRKLTVTATECIIVDETIAVVRLGVQVRNDTVEGTQEMLKVQTAKLIKYLESMKNIAKLKTNGHALYETRNFRMHPPSIDGYRGSLAVLFEVDISKVGAVLDGARQNGANRLGGVAFKATDKALKEARLEAIKSAVHAAKLEASIAAHTAGRHIEDPVNISVHGSFPIGSAFRPVVTSTTASFPVLAQSQKITATATITYETY